MLSRVANSLYWAGRYVERSEHLARYVNVQYFSTLDAPMSQNKMFVLRSIANMVGLEYEPEEELQEEDVLFKAVLDPESASSLHSSVRNGRENARGIRNTISTELWESINKYYHFVRTYPVEVFKTRGLYDFCIQALQHCANIRAHVHDTLIHDDVFALIQMGIHLERAAQITRILSNKLYDISSLTFGKPNHPIENYQWTITLKVLEAFDMSFRYYKASPNEQSICEFLLTHDTFPRSVAYNMEKVNQYVLYISQRKAFPFDSPEFYISKMANHYKFLEYSEFCDNLQEFLSDTQEKIIKAHTLLEKEYMKI